mgnify:CR=1 FL=1
MRNLERRKNKRNLVTLAINDVHQLQSWYMPFITNGGLFLQGNHDYQLGDQFFCCSISWMRSSRYPSP